ncbi:hypothetical protein [Thiobacillus sedimenti]|uniref:Uncharacterized protein n=1 Tax=Thiobacillus sedimenti TaxID=3110231 RepID=A0ABZ1CMH4_9PROT|nr:hypothetical protein [Thiobacillus sp. SCUT-2]WRS40603.1 hypothetical protein VA613_06915 [Thiobacillus sp. SCUT-2]
MSRLICMDIRPGRLIAIQGVRHHVQHVQPGGPLLTLKPEAGGDAIEMPRSELAALLVIEEAEMLDELEDPDADDVRKVTNLSFQPVNRIIDWHGKVFLLRQMMPHASSSPRTAVFRAAFERAKAELESWHRAIGLVNAKTWACRTIYNDLRRWRSFRYALSTVQRKGVEYCPWSQRPDLYVKAEEVLLELVKANPTLSLASLREKANKRLGHELPEDPGPARDN